MKDDPVRFWDTMAKALRRRVNLGWWVDGWTPWLMGASLLGAIALLGTRVMGVDVRWAWIGWGALLGMGASWAWWTHRRRWEDLAAARVRLEDYLGLKSRLSAAASGVGPYPEPVSPLRLPVRTRWERVGAIATFCAAMLWLASWVPVSRLVAAQQRMIEKPTAVAQVEELLEELRKEDAVEQASLEEVEKKVAELMQRPAENWYEHGTLEAAANLQEQTAEGLKQLSKNLVEAERAASALAQGEGLPQAAKDSLANGLDSANDALRDGSMKPGKGNKPGSQKAGGMSKDQLRKMAEKLKQNRAALENALKNSPMAKMCDCDKPVSPGDGPGKGGVSRGRGDAELSLKENETDLGTTEKEELESNLDWDRVAPGETQEITNGEHEVEENFSGPKAGGGISNSGDGGAAVWRNSLLPAEREVLKRFYK